MLFIKKISILGIVLSAASAIAATVLTKSPDRQENYVPGILQGSTAANGIFSVTCAAGYAGSICQRTLYSTTTLDVMGGPKGTSTSGNIGGSSAGKNTTAQ